MSKGQISIEEVDQTTVEVLGTAAESARDAALWIHTDHQDRVSGEGEGGAVGTYSDQMPVTPAEDPIPPQGAFFIGGPTVTDGGDVATSQKVVLFIDAVDTDSEFDGPAGLGSHSVSHGLMGTQLTGMFAASGNVEMRFSNTQDGVDTSPWEPLSSSKNWTLDCADGNICTVYGQFRDGAGNESLVIDQQILLQLGEPTIYLPIMSKN